MVHATSGALVGRRALLAGAAGVAVVSLCPGPALATPDSMRAAMDAVLKGAVPRRGRVTLDIPAIADNGNAVSMTVSVESPMTAQDRVRSIHVFAESNPLPSVVHLHLGPRAGKATVTTRIRLANSQQIVAVAAMADGTFWTDSAQVEITLAACLDD